MSEHVVPLRTYIGVFLGLMALTALTTGVAYIDLGALNTVAALTIAVVKMLLVVLYFMHARYATGLTRVVIIAGFFLAGDPDHLRALRRAHAQLADRSSGLGSNHCFAPGPC
jgi:cytochrome c oxidase subunit 4